MRWAPSISVAAMLVVGGCHKTQDAATGTARFWAWFQKSAPALRRERDLQRVMETISEQIEKVHPGVIAEIGSSGEDRELVISADGRRELFPVVQEIYAARPTVPGWTILAFRPRSDPADPFVTEMDGKKLDPRTMKVTAASHGEKLDITVFVPGFTTLEQLGGASFIVLDHVVGEYDMETKIGEVQWAALDRAPATARPLFELPALLDKAFPPKP